ncbi:MAG TPA: DUF3667 domain-containing protein [Gemmatimonadaceae bacterium]|nr:DUF3667 domain-containing protein [Gemmatimonadaceae bacterium]
MTDLRAPGEDTTLRVQGLPSPGTRWKVQCLNCGAGLHGPFCSACGQRAIPPHPSVRELAGDAVGEFTGWDGKLAETIRTLVRTPGELTRQWLEGRRAHYISPLRLYLSASVLFFLLQASAPDLDGRKDLRFTSTAPSNPERVGNAATKTLRDNEALTPAEKDSALAALAKAPWWAQPLMRRGIEDPEGYKASFRRIIPRTFFALLPLYAGVLALFYRRRNYPDHLYFAIHLHAFVFIALAIPELAKFTGSARIAGPVGAVALAWIAAYSLFALKRVYGGGWTGTVLKAIGIMALYFFIAMPILIAALYAAAML